MEDEIFYKDKFFKDIERRLGAIETGIKCANNDITEIKTKINYMYGFAAGIAFVFSIIISWIKDFFTRSGG